MSFFFFPTFSKILYLYKFEYETEIVIFRKTINNSEKDFSWYICYYDGGGEDKAKKDSIINQN